MANRRPTMTVQRRRWVLSAAILGWILVIVAGAGETTDDSLLGVENVDVIWIVFAVVLSLMGLALLIYANPFVSEWTPPENRRRGKGLWFLVGVVALLWVWRPDFLQDLGEEPAIEELGGGFESEVDTTPDDVAPEVVAQASDLLLIAVGIALLGGVWYFLQWRARAVAHNDMSPNLALETDLSKALDEASHELAITGDPRQAVLRSYAVLETVLAAHGLTRNQAETATEHMQRSLGHLRVNSAPLIELGSLYELARFSDNPITAAQQGAAAQALALARTSLATQT